MNNNSTAKVAIMAVAAVIAVGLMTITSVTDGSGKTFVVGMGLVVIGVAVVSGFRYLASRKEAQAQLTGGENYRQLADEYRRLADLAITAQEHTDLKMGEISAQLDFLRTQNESLQKILRDVE